MKKALKSFIAVIMSLLLCMGTFVGCVDTDDIPQTASDVALKFWSSGLGDVGITAAVNAYNSKQSTYKVWLDPYAASNSGVNFGSSDIDTNDLYMMGVSQSTEQLFLEYGEPLNDILEHSVEGETGKIKDKFPAYYLDAVKSSDGNYYKLSMGGGNYGLVYNTSIIDGSTYTVPTTTIELQELAMMLYDDENAPPAFMNTNEAGDYWSAIYIQWQVQYDGIEYYNKTFRTLTDGNGNGPSKEILTKDDGRKMALIELSKFLTPDYSYPSLDETYTNAQTLFLNGKSAMMPNGTWLLNEMGSDKTNFAMMKIPVISSIIDKCPNVEDDYELRALIKAIDAVNEKSAVALTGDGYSVEQADLDKVWEARTLQYSNYDVHAAFIPKYSNAIDGAKDFLKYLYSDEGMTVYWNASKASQIYSLSGGRKPDMTGWSDWQKSAQERVYNTTSFFEYTPNISPIFYKGGATPYANGAIYITDAFATKSSTDRKTAEQVWDIIKGYHNSTWDRYVSMAGLSK